ncbi:MAG: anaerobic magnesium-protoporphyrin IX monomethyl ester cyclase [Planctomycetota bacterium]|jgi:anaerobic magnesium-protoporphyrin IX monomethyl ester cyclase
MISRKKKIVLYQPQQVDQSRGLPSAKDLLPLEMLAISGLPLQDGYEIQIVDASLYSEEEAHKRLVAACEGAMMYATTGILGYMVVDGYHASKLISETYPDLPMIVGGWFASVKYDLQLATGFYDAVVLAQGELTFHDVVRAIDAGEPLDDIPGLALLRDGEIILTETRKVVNFDNLPKNPWHLIDIEPYREHQMRAQSSGDYLRMPGPGHDGAERKPYFGISYYSSYGCPEPCTFCCSPMVTNRRWKAQRGNEMFDELAELHDRWGFDVVRFHDANWGVAEKRVKDFAERKLASNMTWKYNAFLETHSILNYDPSTLDVLAESGLYIAEIGAEAGTDEMMEKIGKPIKGDDNINASVEMDKRDICASVTYIIGYPHEEEDSMRKTIDQCRRLHVAAPLARPTVWPFRPIPGTVMWDQAIKLGYIAPSTISEWGSIGEYHMEETWPGKIPQSVADMRKMYQHYVTLDYGFAREKRGLWEKRAADRLANDTYHTTAGRIEAKAFSVYNNLAKKLTSRGDSSRSFIDPDHASFLPGVKPRKPV